MSMLKRSIAVLALAMLSFIVGAEEAKPEPTKADETKVAAPETKPADAKPADAKPADAAATTDKPKAGDGLAPVGAPQSDSLVGEVTKGLAGENGKEMKAKKAAKKGISADSIILHVASHGDAEAKGKGKGKAGGREVNLTGDADMLAKLTAFAEKKANIKVTGAMAGDTMTVKEVSEAPAESAKKKKNKNNV